MRIHVALATAGSAALLAGALWFQFVQGLEPCPLCIWQRWPHVTAVVLGLLIFKIPNRFLLYLGLVAMLASSTTAFYHVAVENSWIAPTPSCSGVAIDSLSGAELLDFEAELTTARCDEVAWQFAGLSMAAWNGLLSLMLAAIWFRGIRKLAG